MTARKTTGPVETLDGSDVTAPAVMPDGRSANVVEALLRVMADMPAIGKDNKSPQGYQYRGIEQITVALQPLLAKYGVLLVPHVETYDRQWVEVNGKQWTDEVLHVTYTAYGPGGVDDHITIGPIVGIGRDNSDKGANKAMTQAFKYALLQTLCISDGDDDADGHAAAHAQQAPPPPDPGRVLRSNVARSIKDAGLADEFRAWLAARPEVSATPAEWTDEQVADVQAWAKAQAPGEAPGGPQEPPAAGDVPDAPEALADAADANVGPVCARPGCGRTEQLSDIDGQWWCADDMPF